VAAATVYNSLPALGRRRGRKRLFDEIRARGRYFLTSTRIRGSFYIRFCVLSHRMHEEHVLGAVDEIRVCARVSTDWAITERADQQTNSR
jgi:hypothetical protein